jgi:hypothetical protein
MPESPDPLYGHIHRIRGFRVTLDADLAKLYGVPNKRLNEQVRRNSEKFPDDFCFQLSIEEALNLKSQIATSSSAHGGSRKLPWVFTEHGALMVANVLRSPRATEMAIYVVRAFIKQREALTANAAILKRLAEVIKRGHEVIKRGHALPFTFGGLLSPTPVRSGISKVKSKA